MLMCKVFGHFLDNTTRVVSYNILEDVGGIDNEKTSFLLNYETDKFYTLFTSAKASVKALAVKFAMSPMFQDRTLVYPLANILRTNLTRRSLNSSPD
jgi:hypothetical protein